jgi:hypothetical protein
VAALAAGSPGRLLAGVPAGRGAGKFATTSRNPRLLKKARRMARALDPGPTMFTPTSFLGSLSVLHLDGCGSFCGNADARIR